VFPGEEHAVVWCEDTCNERVDDLEVHREPLRLRIQFPRAIQPRELRGVEPVGLLTHVRERHAAEVAHFAVVER